MAGRLLRSVVQLILLAIAITILYPHGQHVWYEHATSGWLRALVNEWRIAWLPVLIAIVIAILAILLDIWLIHTAIGERKAEASERKREFAAFLVTLDSTIREAVKEASGERVKEERDGHGYQQYPDSYV